MPNSAMLARRVFNADEGFGFDPESGLTAAPARSYFGDVGSYAICAGCGRFHAGSEGGESPFGWLNGDDRGALGPNGKPSLGVVGAGAQITRTNAAWGTLGQPTEITFAFRANAPGTMPSDTAGFTRFTTAQINLTLLSLTSWSDVANITFTRVGSGDSGDGAYSDNAIMLLGNYASGQAGASAFAYLPANRSTSSNSGDAWFNYSLSQNVDPAVSSRGHQIMLHELGHAIGLSHPAAYNASEGSTITYTADAIYYEDTRQYTVMSYFSEGFTGATFNGAYPAAPMLDDISAAQRLYGANMTTRTGDTVYGFSSNADRPWYHLTTGTSTMVAAIWDAGGVDTLNFVSYFSTQTIDLRQGAFSSVGGLLGNVAIALGAVIENAVGGQGADTIFGNAADNVITGGGGDDVIDGGLGSDTVVFSGARAAYTITWNGQTATVTGPDGTDTLTNVDFLRFSDQTIAAQPTGGLVVSGDVTNNVMDGTALADTMSGLGGNDTLNGLGGNDVLNGGSGNDVLNGGAADDTLIGGLGDDALSGGDGSDIADYSGASSGVTVNLALTGAQATGAAGADTLSGIEQLQGSTFNDVLTGDGGDNILRGGGGVDVLNGGGGNDQLFAGAPGETGGGEPIQKLQSVANGGIPTAVSLDGAFDLRARAGVVSATTVPHATVNAVAHGGVEYYAFTVTAGATVTFDIDGGTFDTTLRVFNSSSVEVASNDDAAGDGESGSTDSALTFTFGAAGTYYVAVGLWLSNDASGFVSGAAPAGATYTLHVSVPGHPVTPITSSGSTLNGDAGNDILNGGSGADTLNGGANDDLLTGGGGNDVLSGGDGTDTAVFSGAAANYTITTTNGVTTVSGLDGVDTLTAVERLRFTDGEMELSGALILNGTSGADVLNGGDRDDTITPAAGSDAIDGGAGQDTLVLPGVASNYYFVNTGSGYNIYDGVTDLDVVRNVELVRFGTAAAVTIASAANSSFDAYHYLASNLDLVPLLSATEAYRHYQAYGRNEGRPTTSFNSLEYLASNPDLIAPLGGSARGAAQHYVLYGLQENRPTITFDAQRYTASNPDLIPHFGANTAAATAHYIAYGAGEGRPTNSFSGLTYVASNPDLIPHFGTNTAAATAHYIAYGAGEGRPTNSFSGLTYVASNPDLIPHFGTNTEAAAFHYVAYGAGEGRPTNSFSGLIYLASNPDLIPHFGANTDAATAHYLRYGSGEGRPVAGFDSVAYLLSNADLAGFTPAQALGHWVSYGALDGHLSDLAFFGRDQSSNVIFSDAAAQSGVVNFNGERDWFSTVGGGSFTVRVSGLDSGAGTLADPTVSVYDSAGNLIATDTDSGPGRDALLSFSTLPGSQPAYIVVRGANGATGTYSITLTSNSAPASESVSADEGPVGYHDAGDGVMPPTSYGRSTTAEHDDSFVFALAPDHRSTLDDTDALGSSNHYGRSSVAPQSSRDIYMDLFDFGPAGANAHPLFVGEQSTWWIH